MDTDKALKSLGKYSRYQLQTYFLVSAGTAFPFAWVIMAVVFTGDTPNYRCQIGANDTVNASIPTVTVDGVEGPSQCSMFEEPGVSNATVQCQNGFWYDPASGYESTLVTEFDLTCGKGWLVEFSITILTVGNTISALVSTRLSDLFGRKKVAFFSLWAMVAFTFIQSFSTTMIMYIAIGFFVGIFHQALVSSGFILGMELFHTEQRTFAGMAVELFWAAAYMSLAAIAYFLRNWRHLLMAVSAPFVLTVPVYWLISESLPWLIANKKYKEAKQVLIRAHKMNKTELPDDLFTEGAPLKLDPDRSDPEDNHNANVKTEEQDSPSKTKQMGVIDIFKAKRMRTYTIILAFVWFTNGFVYFSQAFTVTYLPGDRYLNSFLYALMEVPAYLICWAIIQYFGRIRPLSIFMLLCGLALLGSTITNLDCCTDLWQLSLTLSMVAKFCITCSFATVYLNTPEIFPTNVRTIGLGLCSFASKSSTYISPYARLLYRTIPWLTPVILGCLCLVACVLVLFLPETRHTRLPETLEEAEEMKHLKKGDTDSNHSVKI